MNQAYRSRDYKPPQLVKMMLLLAFVLCCQLKLVDSTTSPNQILSAALSRRPDPGPKVLIYPDPRTMPALLISTKKTNEKVLTCRTSGDDPGMFGEIKWSGPRKENNWEWIKSRHIIKKTNRGVTLEFNSSSSYDDSGDYTCESEHQSEPLRDSIKVIFHTPLEYKSCQERQFLIAGSTNGKIACLVTGDSPNASIKKNGDYLDNNRYKWEHDGIIINGAINESDAGEYEVEVYSDLSGDHDSRKINVEIHSKPSIAPFSSNYADSDFHSIEGERAILECKVIGYPRPLVYWLDPKLRNLTSVGGYHVNPEMGTLLIDKVSKNDDDGVFKCIATNTVDEDKRDVKLAVDTRPDIVSFSNVTADEGSEATFECRSSGSPAPNFSIRKHGNDVRPYQVGDLVTVDTKTEPEGDVVNRYIYRLTARVRRENFGLHYCNATNRAGSAERVNQLFVNYKPDLSGTPSLQSMNINKMVFTCHIKAYPEPTIWWTVDGTQVRNPDTSTKISPDQQVYTVTMMPPSGQQSIASSRFVCHARNKMGETEVSIVPSYTTRPGPVSAFLIKKGPTFVSLDLKVSNEGGERIKHFKYKLSGRTLDYNNPLYNYREDKLNETILAASPSSSAVYTIKSLLPYYSYTLTISAVNTQGDGDPSILNFETDKPKGPEPPVIIRPSLTTPHHGTAGIPSDYQNGYVLNWSPPDLDNGDRVIKYTIRYTRIDVNSLGIASEIGSPVVIEQMSDRPRFAKLGPLEVGRRYRVEILATNKYGDSNPESIIIYTQPEKPIMADFETQAISWLTEPSNTFLVIGLAVGLTVLIIIDLIFGLYYQIGVTHLIRTRCCPPKTNSVISDKPCLST